MHRQLAAAIALVALVTAGAAAADPGVASVVARSVTLPEASEIAGVPLAGLLLHDAGSALSMTAQEATIRVFQRNVTVLQTGDRQVRPSTDPLWEQVHQVTDVALAGEAAGSSAWTGIADPSGSSLTATASTELELMAMPRSRFASPAAETGTTDDDAGRRPDIPFYGATVDASHIAVTGALDARLAGEGAFKVMGLHLRLASSQGQLDIATGEFHESDLAVHAMVQRWAFIEFKAGDVVLQGNASSALALSTSNVRFQGEALLAGARGTFEGETSAFTAVGRDETIAGEFSGTIDPATKAGAIVTSVALEGELRSTSFAPLSRAPVRAGGSADLLPWVIVVGVAIAAGGAVVGHRVLRTRSERAQRLDDFTNAAVLAAEREDHAEALSWTESALRLAPTSARLHQDAAFFHAELGNVEEALAAYDRAAGLSTDGEADMNAARLLVGQGDLEAAAVRVARALKREPALVAELEDLHVALTGVPTYEAALRDAARGA